MVSRPTQDFATWIAARGGRAVTATHDESRTSDGKLGGQSMKRWAVGILVVMAAWYGFVLLALPIRFECGRRHHVVREFLRGHIARAHKGTEEFGHVDTEWLKSATFEFSPGNRYTITQVVASDGSVLGLFAQPSHPRNYEYPLWGRLLFLDFGSYAVPKYIARRDGLLCSPVNRGFDAGDIPSADYVVSLDVKDLQANCEAIDH